MNQLLIDDRVLWEDGTISVPSELISKYIQFADKGKLFTDTITPEIEEYNRHTTTGKIRLKSEPDALRNEWIIPKEIMDIKLVEHLESKLVEEIERNNFTDEEIAIRDDRLYEEYQEFMQAGLTPLIYAIMHVINRFEANNVVWGVGRGSSTSSYLLYILGIHDVDSVEYDLDFTEFLH